VRPIIQEYWVAGQTHFGPVMENFHLATVVGGAEGVIDFP
jgi:hypothetical protein